MTLLQKILILLFALCNYQPVNAQEELQKWSLGGYVKDLQTLLLVDGLPSALQDNLLHNRLNFKWYPSAEWTLQADLRSRIFWGDLIKLNPAYLEQINFDSDDFLDLSLGFRTGNDFIFHTTLDRLFFTYAKNKFEVRLGRQRINWGINTVWNPNDIFNAFSFTDFDYEERPGSDALRIQYFTGFASSLELAFKFAEEWENTIIGGRWKFNHRTYDVQLIAGKVQDFISLGGGWAGNIKNAGFKGEFTYFISTNDTSNHSFTGTLGWDYTLQNGTYLNAGFLYNSIGSTTINSSSLFSFELSARNLYPYRLAIFTQAGYPITPLLNASIAIIYSPVKAQAMFINPGITYSIQQNWDLNLIGQLVFNQDGKYKSPVQAIFLRLKFSF